MDCCRATGSGVEVSPGGCRLATHGAGCQDLREPAGYLAFRSSIAPLYGFSALSPLTLVLGGARSGKSRHAEQLLTCHDAPWIYVATARSFDDGPDFDAEMNERIRQHRARRGAGWHTIEAPTELPGALEEAAARPVLVDCLTLWLSNLMLAGHDLTVANEDLIMALRRRSAPTILVANEVGLGIVPATPLGRAFRDAAGRLNQDLAARADRVLFMVAGLPLSVK